MRRCIEGLHNADQSSAGVFPDGLFLVRVERAQYRWRGQKPHYALRLQVRQIKICRFGDGVSRRRQPLGTIPGHDSKRIGDRERGLSFTGVLDLDTGQFQVG